MFKTLTLGAVAALSATVAVPATAEAQPYYGGYHGSPYYQDVGYRDHHRYYGHRGYRGDRGYYRGGRGYYGGRHGYRGRGYCRDKGNGGTVIGAIAGGLLGNQVAGRGDRTVGTVVGAGVGALAGRAIDRDC
jgi:hypothetical protein